MQDPIPFGFCHCGCGEKTTVSTRTRTSRKVVKGKPIRFIHGHAVRRVEHSWTETDLGFTTPCWIWNGFIQANSGYARRGYIYVHRENWIKENGPVPDGLELDHLCRVRHCVNPSHLEPVTRTVNIQRGSGATITVEIARQIKASDGTHKEIGLRFGATEGVVGRIKRGLSWKDI